VLTGHFQESFILKCAIGGEEEQLVACGSQGKVFLFRWQYQHLASESETTFGSFQSTSEICQSSPFSSSLQKPHAQL
jgi:hypothetical protein